MVERIKVTAKLKRETAKEEAVVIVASKVEARKKYDSKTFPRSAKFLAQRGATQAEIADCFQVSTRAFEKWLTLYPELREAVTVGNEAFDTRVERALAERAIGFWVDIPVQVMHKGKLVEVGCERKYFPPDVTAGIFWTKNRMPDRWRDVQRHEVNQVGLKSADELRQLLLTEFKDLVDQGLLQLPAPERRMREINPRGNGHGNGS
jgi:hypothetical protein